MPPSERRRTSQLERWLELRGPSRRQAVKEAACQLLSRYLPECPDTIPVDLQQLANSLGAELEPVYELAAEAVLVPNRGGYRILTSRQMGMARYRLSVAHELAHTLFYCESVEVPERALPWSQEEEKFCFDVARMLLVPVELLEARGVAGMADPEEIFGTLTSEFGLSRPIAALVMLHDYPLANGVAGRWLRSNDGWVLQRGWGYASPSLTTSQRRNLRKMAHRWLTKGAVPEMPYRIVGSLERGGKAAFLLVVVDERDVPRVPEVSPPGIGSGEQLTLFEI